MEKQKLPLPKSLLDLPPDDRDAIITVILQSTTLPKEKDLPAPTAGDEHNMWARNGDDLMGDIEDNLYTMLMVDEAHRMADLYMSLGLPTDDLDVFKSFEPEYLAFEDQLIKGKDSGRNRMSSIIQDMAAKTKKKRDDFLKWVDNGKAFTRDQLKHIDKVLSTKVPNYAKIAERYVTRAAFIGKIRNQADREGFETLGAFIDRVPETLHQAKRQGVVLTLSHQKKEASKGNTVNILPLTEREADAATHASHHAGDKITEISDKHMAGVRQLVIRAKKERWSAQRLAQELFDKFGEHNRDWRRVAITELAFAANDAFIGGCEEGDTLIGMGSVGACKHCQNLIIGKQFTVTHNPPSEDTYHTDMNVVWIGKSNYGRRVAEYVAAVPLHPHCRCRMHKISRFYKLGDNGKLVLKDTAELINEERKKRGLQPDKTLASGGNQEDRLRKMSEQFLKDNA